MSEIPYLTEMQRLVLLKMREYEARKKPIYLTIENAVRIIFNRASGSYKPMAMLAMGKMNDKELVTIHYENEQEKTGLYYKLTQLGKEIPVVLERTGE